MATTRKQYQDDALMIFRKVSEFLNTQIEQHGQLQRDNRQVWDMLHQMDNDIWQAYIDAIKIVDKEFGHIVSMEDLRIVLEVQQILEKFGHLSNSNNIFTPRGTRKNGHNYKGKAWKMVCHGREIWNRAMQIDLPNDDASRSSHINNILEFGS